MLIFSGDVVEFVGIEFACKKNNVMIDGCPCAKCRNVPYLNLDDVKFNLYQNGFWSNYQKWTFHGEDDFANKSPKNGGYTSIGDTSNLYKSMVLDAFGSNYHLEHALEASSDVEEPNPEFKKFFDIFEAAEKPLYGGCWRRLN